jgi:hypothetical protein
VTTQQATLETVAAEDILAKVARGRVALQAVTQAETHPLAGVAHGLRRGTHGERRGAITAGQQRGASGAPWCAKMWGRRCLL